MEKDTYVVVTSTIRCAGMLIPTSIRTVQAYDRNCALEMCDDMDGEVVFCGTEYMFLGRWGELKAQPLTKFDVRHAVKEALKEMKEEKRVKSKDTCDLLFAVIVALSACAALVLAIVSILEALGVIS